MKICFHGKLIIDMVIPDVNEMVSSNGKQEIMEKENPINGNMIVVEAENSM